MRKTKVKYEGGLAGAQTRMAYAAKRGMVMPFTSDEATAYLQFIGGIANDVKMRRRLIEKEMIDMFPEAEAVWWKPGNFDDIRAMSRVLKAAKAGKKLPYTPEMAQAMVTYVHELK